MARDSIPQPDVAVQDDKGNIAAPWYDALLATRNRGVSNTLGLETVNNALAGKQPLNANLTAIAQLIGSGFLRRTTGGQWVLAGLSPEEVPNPFATYLVDESGNYLVDESGNYLVTDTGVPVAVEYGGTGATTAAGARTNLAAVYTDDVAGYIDGLQMLWVSNTALTVGTGNAFIESLGDIQSVTSAIAKTSLSLSASTWYHVYLYLNSGTPDIEIVTTAPVVYRGTARSKTGDTSRRYIGSVKTDASNNVIEFTQVNNDIRYNVACTAAPFRILTAGAATSLTAVSAAAVVPVTSQLASLYMNNVSATYAMAFAVNSSAEISVVNPLGAVLGVLPLNSAQDVYYRMYNASASAYIDVLGYSYTR